MASSNIHDVVSWLEEWLRGVDFTRPGKDQSLGRDIAMVVIRGRSAGALGGIQGRASRDHRGASADWAPNAPKYAEYKRQRYGLTNEPNFRTGQMLSQESLYGKTTIESTVVTLRYGTGSPPARSAAPTGYMSNGDRRVTDTQKAEWNSPKRPFYELSTEDSKAVVEECQDWLNNYITDTNSGR